MKINKYLASFVASAMIVSNTPSLADNTPTVDVGGGRYIVSQSAWDVDFEGEHVGSHRWGAPYVEVKDTATSSTLTNSLGNSLTAHTGTANNQIISEDTGDEAHGNAMKMVANDDAQVQLNEFAASPEGDIIAYELDYMLLTLPQNPSATVTVFQPVMTPDSWVSALAIALNTPTPQFSTGSGSMPMELGKWYSVLVYANFTDRTISYYIDGELLGSAALPDAAQPKGKKMVSKLANATGASCMIDNLKCYSLKRLPDITSVTTSGSCIDIGFSSPVPADNFLYDGQIQNITISRGKNPLTITACEATDNDKILCFTSSAPIPTAVPLDISVNYLGIDIEGTFESSPDAKDVKSVAITQSGTTFTATAIGHNENNEETFVIMVMVLYDGEGRVCSISYSLPNPLVNDMELYVSASSDKAKSAKVFFMNSWDNPTPFKNLYYRVSEGLI